MRDTNTHKRIKMIRRIQGLPTLGDVLKDCLVGALLFGVIVLGYLVIKMM